MRGHESNEGAGNPAPSFDEVFDRWYPRAVWIARERGLSDPEHYAAEVMVTIYRNGYLERFDPSKASLDHFVGLIVRRWMVTYYGREQRKKRLVPQSELTEYTEGAEPSDLFTAFGGMKEMARGVKEGLARSRPDLIPLWTAVVAQFLRGDMHFGVINRRELSEQLGVGIWKVDDKYNQLLEWLRVEGLAPSVKGPRLVDRAPR